MDLYALRLRSQLGDGQSGWRQHMVVTAIGIASEEMLRHSKPCGQPEHDIGVGPRLTDGIDGGGAQLHTLQALQAHIEPGAQPLALPGGSNRQDDICVVGGCVDEEVGMDVELEPLERRSRTGAIRLGRNEIGPK